MTPAPVAAPTAAPAPSAAWDAPSVASGSNAAPAPADSADNSQLIELAAVTGAGILALGGGALLVASRRRRRDQREAEAGVYAPLIEPSPEPAPDFAPAFLAGAPATAALPPDRPLSSVSEESDISGFGRHTQAAYRGPTPDNPSLSLKKRLKRARFFDQREAGAGTADAANCSTEAMIAHARSAREAHGEDEPLFWPHDRQEKETRPAFQS